MSWCWSCCDNCNVSQVNWISFCTICGPECQKRCRKNQHFHFCCNQWAQDFSGYGTSYTTLEPGDLRMPSDSGKVRWFSVHKNLIYGDILLSVWAEMHADPPHQSLVWVSASCTHYTASLYHRLWAVSVPMFINLLCLDTALPPWTCWLEFIMKQFNSYSASCDNWCTVGGDGGEVQAGTTSPMSDHKGFKLQ